jgi:hypothetical protein
VTWRGKTYVGTLLDCTRHDWAPPRYEPSSMDKPTCVFSTVHYGRYFVNLHSFMVSKCIHFRRRSLYILFYIVPSMYHHELADHVSVDCNHEHGRHDDICLLSCVEALCHVAIYRSWRYQCSYSNSAKYRVL